MGVVHAKMGGYIGIERVCRQHAVWGVYRLLQRRELELGDRSLHSSRNQISCFRRSTLIFVQPQLLHTKLFGVCLPRFSKERTMQLFFYLAFLRRELCSFSLSCQCQGKVSNGSQFCGGI